MTSPSRKRKHQVGWVKTADRCSNCTMYRPSVYGQPPMVPGARGKPYQAAACLLYNFATGTESWCEDHERKEVPA